MNDPLLVDNVERQADLNEELPSAQLSKLYQSIVWTGLGKQLLFFLLGNIVSFLTNYALEAAMAMDFRRCRYCFKSPLSAYSMIK